MHEVSFQSWYGGRRRTLTNSLYLAVCFYPCCATPRTLCCSIIDDLKSLVLRIKKDATGVARSIYGKQTNKQTNKQTTTTRKNDRHERRFHSIASTRNQCIPRFKNKTILSRLFNCAISSDYEFNSV
jgi:hypothetical protein